MLENGLNCFNVENDFSNPNSVLVENGISEVSSKCTLIFGVHSCTKTGKNISLHFGFGKIGAEDHHPDTISSLVFIFRNTRRKISHFHFLTSARNIKKCYSMDLLNQVFLLKLMQYM